MDKHNPLAFTDEFEATVVYTGRNRRVRIYQGGHQDKMTAEFLAKANPEHEYVVRKGTMTFTEK